MSETQKEILEKLEPIEIKVIDELKKGIKDRTSEELERKYKIKEEIELAWENYLLISINFNQWIIKKWEEDKIEANCVFSRISEIQEINWEIFYRWELWGYCWYKASSCWYIKYWDELYYKNKCIFTDVSNIQEINWTIYYQWQDWCYKWYLFYWSEWNGIMKHRCIFTELWKIEEKNWEFYYYWNDGLKKWYINLEKKDNFDKNLIFWDIIKSLKKDKKWVYFEYEWFWFLRKKYV